MKLVSIISVNYNQPQITEQLLKSIYKTNTYAAIELIVVDNGSKVNPVPYWRLKFPAVKFIRSEINLGFAGGNNLATKEAKGDYFFLVNNDTEFTPLLIEELLKVAEADPKIGMVSPKIRYFDQPNLIQYMGYTGMNYLTARNKCIGQFEVDKGQYNCFTGPTGYIHGAAMLVKRECVEKAGLMAENFFLYFEEYDWCERIKKAGYAVWVAAEALIYHKESVSVGKVSGLKEYYMNRNRLLFIRRNAPMLHRLVFYLYFGTIVAPRNLMKYLKSGRPDFIKCLYLAIKWNLLENTESFKINYPTEKR
jgi:GT2 family glycosyltransferase